MQNRTVLGALLLGLGFGSLALTETPAPTAPEAAPKPAAAKPAANAQRIDELIKQLGSAKFQERDAASKELEAIGVPAIEALKKAAKTEDLETSKRAGELVRRLEERAFTASLLAPKRVHLKVTDMAALDAVNELAKISGYPIQVQGDRTRLADKKITLDTGEVAFWEALDQLCAKAGLVEQVQQGNAFPGLRIDPVRPIGPPAQIQVPAPAKEAPPPKIQPRPIEKAPLEKAPADKAPVEKLPVEKAPAEKAPEKKPAGEPAAQGLKELRVEVAAPLQAQAQAGQAQLGQAQAAAQIQVQPVQVQGQPIQVQIQVQAQPGQPVQIQPFPAPASRPGQIILVPGTPQKEPTSYAGSVRVRLVPSTQSVPKGEHMIVLDVAAEPRLQSFSVVGTPTLDKIVDDQGQKLTVVPNAGPQNPGNPVGPAGIRNVPFDIVMPGRSMTGQRRATIRIKGGEKEAKALKELSGTVTAQVMGPSETLLSLDNVLKAAGQTAKDKSGGSLQLNSIEKMDNGDYKAQIQLISPQGQNPFGGGAVFGNGVIQMQQVQIQVGGFGGGGFAGPSPGNTSGMPELVDAKGNKFQIAQLLNRRMNFNNGQATQDLTLVFRGGKDHGEPARLVVNGSRQVALTIPFRFENVPLTMLGVPGAAPAGATPAGVAPGAVDVPIPPPPALPPR